jgi:hypothetical protein
LAKTCKSGSHRPVAPRSRIHASGFVIGKCYKRHRATEFLDFLKQIDARVPPDLDVHIIMDNYATHNRKQLRRGVHTSTIQLESDIRSFIERHNQNPRPYRWTKSADEILASVRRFCQKVEQTL